MLWYQGITKQCIVHDEMLRTIGRKGRHRIIVAYHESMQCVVLGTVAL